MKIGLFIPCYVDALYPEVGVATYKLLKKLGLDVEYPEKQTCCGQPMGNAGFQNKAAKLVENYDELFAKYDYVVAPSASCAAYVRFFHPNIVNHECNAAKKTMDVVEFIHDIVKPKELPWTRLKICSRWSKASRLLNRREWTNAADLAVCSLLKNPIFRLEWDTTR